MFCMKCGAKLGEREIKCPLCGFPLPKISPEQEKSLYPRTERPRQREDFKGLLLFFTLLLCGGGGAVLAMDLSAGGGISFSAWVLFGLLLFYIAFLLPRWFRKPNPVIFLPVFGVCMLGLLWYLDFHYGSGWFFPLVLPLGAVFLLLLEAVVTLSRYVRGGKLYIYGGFFIALAFLSVATELMWRAFFASRICLTWSLIPLILLFLLGMGLIIIAIVPSFRAYVQRRFFV